MRGREDADTGGNDESADKVLNVAIGGDEVINYRKILAWEKRAPQWGRIGCKELLIYNDALLMRRGIAETYPHTWSAGCLSSPCRDQENLSTRGLGALGCVFKEPILSLNLLISVNIFLVKINVTLIKCVWVEILNINKTLHIKNPRLKI